MRKLTIIVTGLLIAAVLPATPGLSERPAEDPDRTHKYIEKVWRVDSDAYAHAGWWDGRGLTLDTYQADHVAAEAQTADQERIERATGNVSSDYRNNVTAGGPTDPASGTDSDRPDWIWLIEPESAGALWKVNVTAHGSTIAALDVFKVYTTDRDDDWDNHDFRSMITPTCPTGLVTPIYPEDGEPAGDYLVRLFRIATNEHQLAGDAQGGSDEVRVTLDPDDAPDGYMIAVYPVASHALDGGPEGNKINYNVTVTQGEFDAEDDVEIRQHDTPYSVNTWLSNLDAGRCDVQDTPLPPVPSLDGPVPELPSELGPGDLFASHL